VRAHWRIAADLVLLGMFGGFYIVPLYAMIQIRSEPTHRSRIIAGNNALNALFLVVAAGLAIGLFAAGLSIPQLILTVAIMNAAVALYIYTLVPEFLMRFMAWILIHSVYRLRKEGVERIPEEGAAVVVCNHVSYVDALVLMAGCRRPIRFVMDHQIFRAPLLGFFFRTARAIPIAPAKENPELLERAYDAIARELAAGELVGIFPEGRLTSTGEMGEFRGGIMKILERTPVPVVPMALSGLWQSLFTRNRERLWNLGRLFPRLRLAVGEAVPAEAVTPEALHARVAALRGDWK
jgi:1-acyl-sn-glycerol-3-phosphate acyltransferase